ncbi:MAG: phage major tail tube protein [Campylobacteraceae bacterium]
MTRKIPQAVQDVNVYIDGRGHLGNIKNLKLPDFTQEMIEAKGGISTKYANGSIAASELTFKMNVIDAELYWSYGLNTFVNRVPLVIKGSIYQDTKSLPLVAIITGDFVSVSPAEIEAGKEVEVDVKLSVHFYELMVDNKQAVLFDTKNTICLIGGVDYFAQMRDNL